MCGRHFDIASRVIGGKTLKKWNVSKNINFFLAILLQGSSYHDFTQELKAKFTINYQFYSENEKNACKNCQNLSLRELGEQPIRRRRNELLNADWLKARYLYCKL